MWSCCYGGAHISCPSRPYDQRPRMSKSLSSIDRPPLLNTGISPTQEKVTRLEGKIERLEETHVKEMSGFRDSVAAELHSTRANVSHTITSKLATLSEDVAACIMQRVNIEGAVPITRDDVSRVVRDTIATIQAPIQDMDQGIQSKLSAMEASLGALTARLEARQAPQSPQADASSGTAAPGAAEPDLSSEHDRSTNNPSWWGSFHHSGRLRLSVPEGFEMVIK